jgi:hypothetical protein
MTKGILSISVGFVSAVAKSIHRCIRVDVDHAPLPTVDVHALFHPRINPPLVLPEANTISVDVFAINGVSSTVISQDADIFYETETLAIVHRYKSKTSGLVSTQLWVWYGRKSNVGEREGRKLQELAKRYSTSPVSYAVFDKFLLNASI